MSYKKAAEVLPAALLRQVQEYAGGECLYIPKRPEHKKAWGSTTTTRMDLDDRNRRIYGEYLAGESPAELSRKYYLSLKSIQRIISQQKHTS